MTFLGRGLAMEANGHGGLNASDMGTGKTLMMLALHAASPLTKRTLIICPSSLLANWVDQAKQHITAAKCIVYHGPKRINMDLSTGDIDLVITTYDTLRADYNRYGNNSPLYIFEAGRVVLDEAHEIKNPATERFGACVWIGHIARFRWCLTGTPIQNSPNDLMSLKRFIHLPEALKLSIDKWKEEYFIAFKLMDINLSTIIPKKNVYTHRIQLSNAEMKEYKHIKTNIPIDENESMLTILTKLLRLRQVCDGNSKFIALMEILTKIPTGDKVIIFTQFINIIKNLQTILKDFEPLIYYGEMTLQEKNTTIEKFNTAIPGKHGEGALLLMSLKAGGVGLNLSCANHVVIFEPWWNSAVEDQAAARIHRIGQTKDVHVHHLITLNTIEEWLLMLQQLKLGYVNTLYGQGYNLNVNGRHSTVSKQQLYEFFKSICY